MIKSVLRRNGSRYTGYELAKNFNITYQVYLKSIIC